MPVPTHWHKHVRLRAADYSNGYFFVTVVTAGRQPILTGASAESLRATINALPERFAGWSVDTFELMPDHFHLILIAESAKRELGEVVGAIKSLFVKWHREHVVVGPVWQRGYYDRIIRTERELANVRTYIMANPWVLEVDWHKVPEL